MTEKTANIESLIINTLEETTGIVLDLEFSKYNTCGIDINDTISLVIDIVDTAPVRVTMTLILNTLYDGPIVLLYNQCYIPIDIDNNITKTKVIEQIVALYEQIELQLSELKNTITLPHKQNDNKEDKVW